MGSRGRKAGTELFLNYSYDNSYEWADEPEPEADFHHHPRDFSFHRPGTGGADAAVSLTAAAMTANVVAALPPAAEPKSPPSVEPTPANARGGQPTADDAASDHLPSTTETVFNSPSTTTT